MSDPRPLSFVEAGFRVAERFGVPVLLLAVMVWFLREAAVTLHGTVLVPIVESHTEFLESTRETLDEMGKTQLKQAETLQAIAQDQHEIKAAVVKRTGSADSASN
jgi:hypothetical protein